MDGRPKRRNKAAFSSFSYAMCTGPILINWHKTTLTLHVSLVFPSSLVSYHEKKSLNLNQSLIYYFFCLTQKEDIIGSSQLGVQ